MKLNNIAFENSSCEKSTSPQTTMFCSISRSYGPPNRNLIGYPQLNGKMSSSFYENDNDEEPVLMVSRRPRFFMTEPTDAPLIPWDKNPRRWKNRSRDHPMATENPFTLYRGWRRLGMLENLDKRRDLDRHWEKLKQEELKFQQDLRLRMKQRKALRTPATERPADNFPSPGPAHYFTPTKV